MSQHALSVRCFCGDIRLAGQPDTVPDFAALAKRLLGSGGVLHCQQRLSQLVQRICEGGELDFLAPSCLYWKGVCRL